MDSISGKVGYPVLELGTERPNTNEYSPEGRKIVVFDDLVNAGEKIQNKIAIILRMKGITAFPQFI